MSELILPGSAPDPAMTTGLYPAISADAEGEASDFVTQTPESRVSISLEETIDSPLPAARERTSRRRRRDGGRQDYWDSLIGKRLDQYQIEALLGKGSMARVYRARHLALDRVCALKILDPRLVARQPGLREQFWAEARSAANLNHPHVVTIHSLGSSDGYSFIEMEYVPGATSLKEWVIRRGPLEPLPGSRLVRQVVMGLDAAHQAGLVHRDVKPANVLLTHLGYAKLADFGLSRPLVGMSAERLAGTPTFMAPELFQGAPASARSDIYAVGVMLFYLLSGRLPFVSDSIRTIIRLHRNEPVPDIRALVPGLPEGLLPIFERCLAKHPADRYETAGELADALRVSIQGLRDTESLLRESLQGVDCFFQGSRDNFRIILPQQEGKRLQEVLVEAVSDRKGERYLSVFSVCGPADPAHYAQALALNARLTYGSLSIRRVLDTDMFVMVRTFPRDHVRTRELRDAILEIARQSDRLEQQLSSADLY
jgi:serine/threonine-protein kinase